MCIRDSIYNAFNEFRIYRQELEADSLNPTKLLAILLYKNVYPDDFEDLHHRKGVLHSVCSARHRAIDESENGLRIQLRAIKDERHAASQESMGSIQELRRSYIACVLSKHERAAQIVIGGEPRSVSWCLTDSGFSSLRAEVKIKLIYYNRNQAHQNDFVMREIPLGISFNDIEFEVNKDENYDSRERRVGDRLNKRLYELSKQIASTQRSLSTVPLKSMQALISDGDLNIANVITAEGKNPSDYALLDYLVRNGHIDENYYVYISRFHEGSLSQTDMVFLRAVSCFRPSPPTQPLDNPQEVINNMRPRDFRTGYALNVRIVDHILKTLPISESRLYSILEYIRDSFEAGNVTAFFEAYLTHGRHLCDLTLRLSEFWPRYALQAIGAPESTQYLTLQHIRNIIIMVSPIHVAEKMNIDNVLSDFISENADQLFMEVLPEDLPFETLRAINVRFVSVRSLSMVTDLVTFSLTESRYEMSPDNILFFLSINQERHDLNPGKSNYSYICMHGVEPLQAYIKGHLIEYIKDVFLVMPDNTDENEDVLLDLLRNGQIDLELKRMIIDKQNCRFEDLSALPGDLWPMVTGCRKIVPNWNNLSLLLSNGGALDDWDGPSALVAYLSNESVIQELIERHPIHQELDEKSANSLSLFLMTNEDFSCVQYPALLGKIGKGLRWKGLGGKIPSPGRIAQLLTGNRLALSEESYSMVRDDSNLLAQLLENNFQYYLENIKVFATDSETQFSLIKSRRLTSAQKMALVMSVVNLGSPTHRSPFAVSIAQIIATNRKFHDVGNERLTFAIRNHDSIEVAIEMLTEFIEQLDEPSVMKILTDFPVPFSEIAVYGQRPKIDARPVNIRFVEALQAKNYISSHKTSDKHVRVNTFASPEHD